MLSLQSPAKINLFLRIFHRRPDGYHELASLFQAINICDKMHFEIAEKDNFRCNDLSLSLDHTNLVIQAVELFRKKTGIKTSFAIHLEKNIPMHAGLGGGSSNAATTLWALNFLSGRPATEIELAKWGAEIGSDISFFLTRGTAYCTGRGEILNMLPPLRPIPLFIVKPQIGLSTPYVYGKLDTTKLPLRSPEHVLTLFLKGTPEYFNDLEVPAFEIAPELAAFKQKLLQSGFSHVLMSGSGSSFFCVGDGDLSDLPPCLTFKADFMNRQSDDWY